MNYIIFDLEWNRVVKAVKKRCPDEIIQIGAVKYNDKMQCIGTFDTLIRPVLYKRMESTVSNLTGLSYEVLKKDGVLFSKAIKEFKKFVGKDCVLMSWGAQDAQVLRSNCLYFNSDIKLDFLKQFADVQRYATHILSDAKTSGNQMSVSLAAELCNITYDKADLHDALVDATLSGMVFAKIFDYDKFSKYIVDASSKSCSFKDVPITDLNNKKIDKSVFKTRCPECGRFMLKKRSWYLSGTKFLSSHICLKCKKQYICSVEILKTYGNIIKYKKRIKQHIPENKKSK